MGGSDATDQLMDAGKEEIESLLRELSGALDDEFTALRTRQLDAFTLAVERKAALVGALEAATGKYCHSDGELPQAWDSIRTLAEHCVDANRVNGGAIELNRGLTTTLLDTIYGGRLETPTYNATGKVRRRDSVRQVGYI